MDRLFRIDFYPQDWLIDTARLTPEERGLFIQIVCLIYSNRGPIDNDAAWIAGVSGCSSRMARSLVEKLVEKNFLQINSSGKIGQKRSENEMKSKRNHLEQSAKGGRNSAEKKQQNKQNNNLTPSDELFSVRSPSPPHPTPISSNTKHLPSNPREDDGRGVFKNGNGKGEFKIENHLTDQDREKARSAAPGWDLHPLFQTYDAGIREGKRDIPRYPARAFIAWLPKYTKGQRP